MFLHYAVSPRVLQPHVPFELDLHDGEAFISLVAFTMSGLRFDWPGPIGGTLGRLLGLPAATHELLNVRTYVRHGGERAIYFIREWIPNRLSAVLGPPTYGLPYRPAALHYDHEPERGLLCGWVRPYGSVGRIVYRGHLQPREKPAPCALGSTTEFLLERYTALTMWRGRARLFRIWHPPWRQMPVRIEALDDSAVATIGPWYRAARFTSANYSPGVHNVWMGPPRSIIRSSPGRCFAHY